MVAHAQSAYILHHRGALFDELSFIEEALLLRN